MDLRISDLQKMQTELQDSHPQWGGVTPARGRDQLLWGIREIGEMIDIIKKRGEDEIMNTPETRRHFVEEIADVMMYFTDVMLCFGITPEEYSEVHARKHAHNMKRDWNVEIAHMFEEKEYHSLDAQSEAASMDLRFSDLLGMQTELQNKYLDKWGGTPPSAGRHQLLWGIGEVGEVIDIIKKRGEDEIMNTPETRRHFIEEMADVMMYFADVMLCFGITSEEYSEVHARKHAHNMKRDWPEEIAHMFDKTE